MYFRTMKLFVLFLGLAAMEIIFSIYVSNNCQKHSPGLEILRDKENVPTKAQFAVSGVNCSALAQNNSSEMSRILEKASNYTDLHKGELRSFLTSPTRSCHHFLTSRGYVTYHLTDVERDFPIAYGILIYTDLDRFERLLRAIYRPQNFYCVHADAASGEDFHRSLRTLLSCFPNVFQSSRSVWVHWGLFSVLEADLACMRDLLRFRWKYFINLTGQEFPLKTNKQLVQILKAYKGANDIRGASRKFDNRRVKNKGPPPFNLSLMKGPVHIAASRGFAEFIFKDTKTQIFLEWLRETKIPDETFYATINNNPHFGAPGGFRGPARVREFMTSFIRYKVWGKTPCGGIYRRQICIFNVGDLPRLVSSKALFANKFDSSYGQYAYDCLEQLLWHRVIDEFENGLDFDTSFYSALPNVVYRN